MRLRAGSVIADFLRAARGLAYGGRRGIRNLAAGLAIVAGGFAPAHAEDVILAFGDSLTAGYGLPVEEGFVPQLEAWLREAGADVRVLNGGVSGDTTAMGRARLGWALGDGPDLMILTLGANDMLRGMDPADARDNLEAMIEEAEASGARVLLVGMSAAGNYGAGYREAFDGMYPALAEAHGLTLYGDFFAPLLGADLESAREEYIQPDGLHPNAAGVARIVEGLGPVVLDELAELPGGAG
ncbi:arylesterase [Pseudoroseicyclus sp. CXY001]|uniref:arylesterase n=1 Tax=Pseudoroseicyclus sp. CXY001 TaxID=3242492 RepID=UPI0035716C19